jgi:hypothetical protein
MCLKHLHVVCPVLTLGARVLVYVVVVGHAHVGLHVGKVRGLERARRALEGHGTHGAGNGKVKHLYTVKHKYIPIDPAAKIFAYICLIKNELLPQLEASTRQYTTYKAP